LWRDERAANEAAPDVEAAGDAKAAGFSDGFMPEVFERMYAASPTPVEAPAPAAALRARLHTILGDLPEYETLRKQAKGDATWSGLATVAIGESIADALPAAGRGGPADADKADRVLAGIRALEALDAVTSEDVGRVAGEAFKATEGVLDAAEGLDESAVRHAFREGIAAAKEAIDDAESAMTALGYGAGRGDGSARLDMGTARELAARVRNSDTLKRIMALAGRLQSLARGKRSARTEYARSEVVGVEPTNDLGRVLSSELASMGDPTREADFFRRLGDREALGYKMAGKEPMKKGPIVVGLDVSGSMGGDKDIWAKAIALACLDTAIAEGRAFGLILFNGKVVGETYAATPRDVDPLAILDLLSISAFAGCDFDLPIHPVLDCIAKAGEHAGAFKKADAILITDAAISRTYEEDPVTGAKATRERATRLGAHVFGITIGAGRDGATLTPWTDEHTTIADVSKDTAATDMIFDRL
jgi:uncharacterized protein with von Willebrand factor type A (vWA) domain